jgi:glycosyltransferase involved in cell wall biosynthesis
MPPAFRVVAIVAAYNEADVIRHVVGDLIEQGVHVYVVDDGSTDGTAAAIKRYAGRGVIRVERLPPAGDGRFDWTRILARKEALARELEADWFIHHDADEFRESPWSGVPLGDALRRVDALGYNAVDFLSLDFWPTHDRFRAGQDPREAFTGYAERGPFDRVQVRCWKKTDAPVDLTSSGGHDAQFPGRCVFPIRFIARHYPIRGQAHGERKVFAERRRRYVEEERARGWHVQYDDVREGASFIRDPATLTPYDPDAVRLSLALRHRGVESLEASLSDARAAADAHRRELDRHRDELAACREGLSRLHDEQARYRDEQCRYREALGRAEQELARHVEEQERYRAAFARCEDELARHRAEHDRYREEQRRSREALTRMQEALQSAQGELAARDANLSALHDELARHLADLSALRADLAMAQADRDARSADIAALRDRIDRESRALHSLQAEANERLRRLDELLASRTWRWSAPARAAFRALGGR